MKRNALILVVGLLIAPLFTSASDVMRFGPAKITATNVESTQVTIKGTSSLHEWDMHGSTINGAINADPEAWKTAAANTASVTVTIPAASIKSEHSRMDRIMLETLKTEKNPIISYQLATASLAKNNGDSFVVHSKGKLSIAGVTRDVAMDVTATRLNDNRYILTGEAPILMTDYGMKPPVAMMGTLKTGNEVRVSFRWVVQKEQ